MKAENWSCSICHSKEIRKAKKYPAKSKLFSNRQLIQCASCGTKSIFPMVSDEELEVYNKDYWSNVQSDSEESRKTYQVLALSRANYLAEKIGDLDNFRILDVGSGQGFLIDELKKKFPKIKASAVEIDTRMHEMLNEKCEHVFTSWEEIKDLNFDLITLSHILEHMTDPIKFALTMKSLLEKKGYIFIDIPNSDDLYRESLESHLIVFNEESLHRFIKEIEMNLIDFTSLGRTLRKRRPTFLYRTFRKILPKFLFQKYRVLRTRIKLKFSKNKSIEEKLELNKTGKNRSWFRVVIRK